MAHPVLILARNNMELTKKTIASVEAQDVSTAIYVIDNDSTDGTTQWLAENGICKFTFRPQLGVSDGWNFGLRYLFKQYDHVLVLNNDVILPYWFYRFLLGYDMPFITGVAIDTMPTAPSEQMPLSPNPDFSAFLIRKKVWEEVGEFNVDMKFYASDCDYHVRGHRECIPMLKANVPYFHASSSTLKNANPDERRCIEEQANSDRKVFRDIYGCIPGEPAYNDLFR